MKFDPKMEAHPQDEPAKADSAAAAVDSASDSESQNQEPSILVYRYDPTFLAILQDFQKAEWEACLEKIAGFLGVYPGDEYLLAFKDEIESRLKLQKSSQKQQLRQKYHRLSRFALRILFIVILGLAFVFLLARASNLARVREFQQNATLTAVSIAAQYERADSYMDAGIPEEALRIYREIEEVTPEYKDIAQKIKAAEQELVIVNLYDSGNQALSAGQPAKALEIFSTLVLLRPNYKNTPELIAKINQEQKIDDLTTLINDAYLRGDWRGVVQNYEAIRAIDPFIQLPDLKDALFFSYRKLILDMAGRQELTLADIETMEKYYDDAIALFPQSKEYVNERDELQKISLELQANKYYLQTVAQLEDSHYSQKGLQTALGLLAKARSTSSNSPAVIAGIEKAQIFLDSYNNLLNRRWDDAITGLEQLSRKDENYADGRVKYFLYEAYTARGDLLMANAEFQPALNDYQQAEKVAWGDQGNVLRLFQIEARVTNVLHILGQDREAAEFYYYIFDLLAYQKNLTAADEQDLLSTLTQADQAYKTGKPVEAVRLYELAMMQKEKFYQLVTVSVQQDDTLVNIAFENGSTLESLRAFNQFGESLVILKDQILIIPIIPAAVP